MLQALKQIYSFIFGYYAWFFTPFSSQRIVGLLKLAGGKKAWVLEFMRGKKATVFLLLLGHRLQGVLDQNTRNSVPQLPMHSSAGDSLRSIPREPPEPLLHGVTFVFPHSALGAHQEWHNTGLSMKERERKTQIRKRTCLACQNPHRGLMWSNLDLGNWMTLTSHYYLGSWANITLVSFWALKSDWEFPDHVAVVLEVQHFLNWCLFLADKGLYGWKAVMLGDAWLGLESFS